MSHDPMCFQSQGKWDGGCQCELINKVRVDERSRWAPPWMSEDYARGYRQGQDDARATP